MFQLSLIYNSLKDILASSKSSIIKTPLPAASPSALSTIGIFTVFRYSLASVRVALVNVWVLKVALSFEVNFLKRLCSAQICTFVCPD